MNKTYPLCRTKLAWKKGDPAKEVPPELCLLVREDLVREQIRKIAASSAFVAELSRYGAFSNAAAGAWGFAGSLEQGALTDDGFVPFTGKLPRAKKLRDEKCAACGGSGHDDDRDADCLRCDGNGRPVFYDYVEVLAIGASLTLLAEAIFDSPHEETASPRESQLITFNLAMDESNYALSGRYGYALVHWLQGLSVQPIREVGNAMFAAHDRMMVAGPGDERQIRAELTQGHDLILYGNSSDYFLSPQMGHHAPHYGRDFTSHYMDYPALPLMFLAGLAELETLVRPRLASR